MGDYGYPPSPAGIQELQPEVCDLCATIVGGARLMRVDVQGLRSAMVCDETLGCRMYRSRPSYSDRRRLNALPATTIGSGRVFPPGAEVATE